MDRLSDIVLAAKDGDVDAFGSIVHRFQDMAYGRAYAWLGDHGLAEDAAQEAFIDAYLHLDQLREPAAFPGWFGRIVVKHSDRVSRRTRPTIDLDSAPPILSDAPDPFETTHQNEMARLIHAQMSQLTDEHREAVELFHFDGFSQSEVAAFLDVPVSTVKKRLFDARRQLKRRLKTMAPTKTIKPSQDDAFKRRVQFFIAIRTRDFATLESLLSQDPTLITATSDPDTFPIAYGLRESTPLFWAVQTGDEEMLDFLLGKGADVNATVRSRDTPLHQAVMMGEIELARHLIAAGADVEARGQCEFTVLHRAAISGDDRLVELLVSSDANLSAEDSRGKRPIDWAAAKSRREVFDLLMASGSPEPAVSFADTGSYLVAESERSDVLGRMIDADGKPVDGQGPIEDESIEPCARCGVRGAVWETGIKPVDLFAPIKRGGIVGKEFCLGVGSMLLYGQVIHNVVTRDNARVVYIVAPEEAAHLALREYWYGMANTFRNGVVFVVGDPNDEASRLRAAVDRGFGLANAFRDADYDVLVKMQGRLFPHADFSSLDCGADENGSITTFLAANPPNGLSDLDLSFDTVIHMSPNLASEALYPAIDDELSRSCLLEDGTFGQDHLDTVAEVRNLFYQYTHFNLKSVAEGKATLYMSDGNVTTERMKRTRRLRMFLTQGYHGTEMWTNKPGETVPLAHTVETCREILDGKYDDVPLKAMYMGGRVERMLERAKKMEGADGTTPSS